MRPSDIKIYKLLDSKHTVSQIADIVNWKYNSVYKSIQTLVKENMVLKYEDGYIATYKKTEEQIKAHNPFNL